MRCIGHLDSRITMILPIWLLIGIAGALGALSRYGLSRRFSESGDRVLIAGVSWPTSILIVNALGCFLAGGFLGLLESRWTVSEATSAILIIGFFGAFTTFSAFALETLALLRASGLLVALTNVVIHNLITLGCVFAGYYLFR